MSGEYDAWYEALTDDQKWAHCGKHAPHDPHVHTIVFNEGPYPDIPCVGVPAHLGSAHRTTSDGLKAVEWTDLLSDVELTVLDLALAYFKDTTRVKPDALSSLAQRRALVNLHDDVMSRKRTST